MQRGQRAVGRHPEDRARARSAAAAARDGGAVEVAVLALDQPAVRSIAVRPGERMQRGEGAVRVQPEEDAIVIHPDVGGRAVQAAVGGADHGTVGRRTLGRVEAVEEREHAIRGDAKKRARVVGPAAAGAAVEIAVGAEEQARAGVRAVRAGERVQRGQRAVGGQPEDRPRVVAISGAVEEPVLGLDQWQAREETAVRVKTVDRGVLTRRGEAVDRVTGGTVEVAVRAPDGIPVRLGVGTEGGAEEMQAGEGDLCPRPPGGKQRQDRT